MKMEEWVGRRVKTTRRLETRGKLVIPAGSEMVVAGHHRGRLSLRDPKDGEITITQVNRHRDVELLPLPTVAVALTRAELTMLIEGLDSHRYWQLADAQYRHDGFVREPGSDDPENVEAIEQVDALEARLEDVRRQLPDEP